MKNGLLLLLPFLIILQVSSAEKFVAEVNGVKIKKSSFDENYRENLLFVPNKQVTKDKVLTDMINRELGIMRAKKSNLQDNPVVKKKMEDVLFHALVSKEAEPELKKIGKISDQDIKKYYEGHKEYRLAHILLRINLDASKKDRTEKLKLSLELNKKLKDNPKLFANLADKYSQSITSSNGGDLGFQPAVRLPPEIFTAVKGQKIETILPPIQTNFGLHIVKIIDIKKYKDINKAMYQKIVYDYKRDLIMDQYYEKHRKKASIKIYKENI